MKNDNSEKKNPLLNDENSVYKTEEYKKFALWLSLPSLIKGKDKDTLKLQADAGFDDEEVLELLQLKTRTELAEKLGVHIDTLTDWAKRLQGSPMFEEIKLWVSGLLKNVVLATYRSAMSKDPKAHLDRKLMLQIGGWVEKLSVDHTAEGLAGIIRTELDSFRKEHEQPTNSKPSGN